MPTLPRIVCPHCGKPVLPRRIEPAETARLEQIANLIDENTHYGRVFRILAPRLGQWISRDQLLNGMYEAEGGPHDAPGVLSVVVHTLRQRIACYHLTIEGRNHRGGSAYRMLYTNGDVSGGHR